MVLLVALSVAGCVGNASEPPRPSETLSDWPERAAAGPWNQIHRVEVPDGWTVTARNVGIENESTSLSGPAGAGCLVEVRAGEPSPQERRRTSERVVVQGITGHYGEGDPDFGHARGVFWPYRDQAWASVSCEADRETILDLAERVRFEPNPVRLPFSMSALPERLPLTQVIEDRRDERTSLSFGSSHTDPTTMAVSNVTDDDLFAPGQPLETLRVNGRTVELRSANQTLCMPTRSQPICIFTYGEEISNDWNAGARDLALHTADVITPVDDPTDQTTWIDTREALP